MFEAHRSDKRVRTCTLEKVAYRTQRRLESRRGCIP
jgi:hypothetical protein